MSKNEKFVCSLGLYVQNKPSLARNGWVLREKDVFWGCLFPLWRISLFYHSSTYGYRICRRLSLWNFENRLTAKNSVQSSDFDPRVTRISQLSFDNIRLNCINRRDTTDIDLYQVFSQNARVVVEKSWTWVRFSRFWSFWGEKNSRFWEK